MNDNFYETMAMGEVSADSWRVAEERCHNPTIKIATNTINNEYDCENFLVTASSQPSSRWVIVSIVLSPSPQLWSRAANEPSAKFEQSWRRPLLRSSAGCFHFLIVSMYLVGPFPWLWKLCRWFVCSSTLELPSLPAPGSRWLAETDTKWGSLNITKYR